VSIILSRRFSQISCRSKLDCYAIHSNYPSIYAETACCFYVPATVAGWWSQFTSHNTKALAFGWC